jgi:tetratricopeptide (TPR) repeat protein
MGQLADSYKEFGWFNKALALEEKMLRAVRLLLKQAEEVAPFYLRTMFKLGISYSRMGRLEEALKVQEEVYQTLAFDLDLSPDHPSFRATMQCLAISYSKLGRPEDAIRLLKIVSGSYDCRLEAMLGAKEESLRLRREKLGADHPDTLRAMTNLAVYYGQVGRLPEAVSFLRRCAAESPAIHAGVRYNLACYECLSGNLNEAKRLITEELATDPEKKEQAFSDEDLAAIRDYIASL